MNTRSVLDWLSNISDIDHQPCKRPDAPSRKRRRPLTPDSTNDNNDSMPTSDDDASHPHKRHNAADDMTPRPTRKRIQTVRSESDYSLASPSRDSSASQRSGSQSPRKQFHVLRLQADGIIYRDLPQFTNKPTGLRSLLDSIDDGMDGNGIIPSSQQPSLVKAARDYDEFRWAARGNYYFSDNRDAVGQTPSVEDVLRILDNSVECSAGQHHEDGWNKFVHAPLLELAFHPRGERVKDQLVSFTSCVHASIISDYGTRSTAKKVDFCIYINPSNDRTPSSAPTVPAIKRLIHQLPRKAFNPTDFVPLEERPIALSIETKRPAEGFDGAKLQLGVWQMAHWSFLRHLMDMQSSSESARSQELEQEPSLAEGEGSGRRLQYPEFLPGIIIQGHNWHLVITTFNGSQTTFWQKVPIGSTDDTKGIYKLVHSLQVLRNWVDKSYWPWLRGLILQGDTAHNS
ncbi:hypothetical protein B0T10DRAFT_533563 [Thelonectria olida]|uniref:PD-(D/E)XK nuclease-like domain-containing protein n=1 Tax=Thelonectria olida TaxID=1576542 RepID=A0A9P8VPY1_9HYPO|nr:hypothetical protein B0T10DRAFT_533563 [Thelonectria olida]